jgi:hypothetical protein
MHPARLAAAVLAISACCLPTATASAGTITGRVSDEISGAPVQNIQVGAGPVGYGLREYTRTAPDGTFAIDEPKSGMYNVCYLPDPGVNFLKRCWRDESVGFYGQAIAVPETGVVDAIDTALAPGTSVTGKVTGWDGQPLAGICVTAWAPQSGGIGRVADATTSAAGAYTLVGLTPGAANKIVFDEPCNGGMSYPGFVAQWFDRQTSYAGATAVSAARSETRAGVDGVVGPAAIPPAGVVQAAGTCAVPTLRNRTFASARTALARAGCSTPMPTLRASRTLRRGRVISSRPPAKQRIRRGRRVKLVVSRGR